MRVKGLLLSLLLLLVACGGNLGGTPVPTELRGQWQTYIHSIPTYYPYPRSVPIQPGENSLLGIFFYFWPDGRYQHVWNLTQTYYGGNCFRTMRWDELGMVRIAEPSFTFQPNKATLSVLDSCGTASLNQFRPQTFTLNVSPDQDQAGWPHLRVYLPSGEELLMEKCRDCK